MKRESPYKRLQRRAMEWIREVKYPQIKSMFFYSKNELEKNVYDLNQIYERVEAAKQLGYECILMTNEHGLYIKYRKLPPLVPWELRDY